MPIERGKIREYATATGAARPAYLDDPKAPVPPTFLATVVFWTPIGQTLRSPEALRARSEARMQADLGSLLSLEQEARAELAIRLRKYNGTVVIDGIAEFAV